MKIFSHWLIILLLITPMICEAQIAAQKSPRVVASEFYALVVKENPSGLPDVREMRMFKPYLSRSLRTLFSRARNAELEAVKRTPPQDKPPILEGSLFSCLYEGPKQYRVGRPKILGRFAYMMIEQSAEPDEWTDTLVLVKENGRWLVWDVRMGCSWPSRMGPTLRSMLGSK